MPRIPNQFLDCSIFLYDSVKAAQDGEGFGGSGFLVHVPSKHEGWVHPYAVTNRHIIDHGFHVLRLNTVDGRTDTISTEPESWFLHPDDDDIAILPIEMEGKKFKWFSIATTHFITPDIIANYRVGPGDEAFLIGRLITVEGRQRNTPVVRFGNISMMADASEPIIREDGQEQESFLVECRSLSGFSGSPVFVSTSQTYDSNNTPQITEWGESIPTAEPETGGLKIEFISVSGTFGPWLLGIDWGHLPLWKPVYEKQHKTKTDYIVDANTGIACVVPSWRILDLLNQRELVRERKRDDEEIARRKRDAAI